ncbi:MAG: 4Fe-4S dicluster domain-containing protein [Bacteroidales bacterium]|nr:4Fe-4S dicluster domain-containing protein [Candidatus Liminaster caballi]
MMKKIRVALALVFWLGVTLLFLDLTGAAHAWLGWMAKLQFLPAVLAVNVGVIVLIVAVTLLIGRLYCSVICPLGVMQDGISWLAGKCNRDKTKRRFGRFHYSEWKLGKGARYGLLGFFLVALVFGMGTCVQLLAPYSSYGRMVTTIVRPLVDWLNNVCAGWCAAHESYAFYSVEVWMRSLPALIVAVVSFVLVFVMSWFGGRAYCNSICPVGTVLGLLSRRSLVRINIDADKCSGCGLCERRCKAMAIDSKNHTVDTTRCVDCFDCLDACNRDALSFGLAKKGGNADTKDADTKEAGAKAGGNNAGTPDQSRRSFIATATALAAASVVKAQEKTTDGGYAILEDKKPYRRQTEICPPGAISLKNVEQKCTGCMLCVSACPNNVLRPSSSLSSFMKPGLSFEMGHCRPECHACSDVCPAGAIIPLGKTHEEKMARKSSLKIGRAVWIKDNCVPVADGRSCGLCSRRCPAGAISMVALNPDDPKSLKVPSVDDERCIGCGACEHLCPVRPFSAIHVEGIEVQREL